MLVAIRDFKENFTVVALLCEKSHGTFGSALQNGYSAIITKIIPRDDHPE
jgi:hypothetical protein